MEMEKDPIDERIKVNDNVKDSDEINKVIIVDEETKKEFVIKKEIIKKDKILFDDIHYENLITKDIFISQLNHPFAEKIYLDKIFFYATEYFCEYHTKNYEFIEFKTSSSDYFETFLKIGNLKEILEIFTKKGIGVTTYMYITFLKFRKEKNIHFIYIDINLYEKVNTTKELFNCLYFFVIGLFNDFNDYNKFCKKIFLKLKNKKEIEKEKILLKIIYYYIRDHIITKKDKYKPCIIIDHFYNKYQNLYQQIEKMLESYYFSTIIIYNLEDQYSNEKFFPYISKKEEQQNKLFYFMNDLYDNISNLPNKHKNYFRDLFPSISNYIKINNINKEEDAKKFYDEQINNIKKDINNFYNNDNSSIGMFANQIFLLINKKLNKNSKYIQDIICNLPLN